MRIAVIGTGVVGSYFGGYLAHGERMLCLSGAEETRRQSESKDVTPGRLYIRRIGTKDTTDISYAQHQSMVSSSCSSPQPCFRM
jgi:ketopantoate reductase